MSKEMVIASRGLTKHYGRVRAVDGIDLDVRRGEIYGFLGRNGAGKTTTIRMLLGLIRPSAGEITLLDSRIQPGVQAVLSRVGCLVESATAYANLTVIENLDIQRLLTGAPHHAIAEVIELLGLNEYAERRAGQLSLGNKQRLALARALLPRPDLLVLDEPANGLDPAGIIEIRSLLRRLADEQGVTIFMSSHILAEIAHLVDRIGIVHAGKLIEELSFAELCEKTREYVDIKVSKPDRATRLLAEHLGITRVERTTEGELRVFDGLDRLADIARVLVKGGLDLTRLSPAQEDLEAHFMRLTERAA